MLVTVGAALWLTFQGRLGATARQQALAAVDNLRAGPLAGIAPLEPTPTPVGPVCDSRKPQFLHGFAALKLQLGAKMGDPLECEQAIHISGDTRVRTTTGHAYYRTSSNIPAFTNGFDHWALTTEGLVYWAGDVVDPPVNTIQVDAAPSSAPTSAP